MEPAIANPITQVMLPVFAAAVMFALGTTLSVDDLRYVVRRPRGFWVGFLVHGLVMPLLAFALALGLGLTGSLAVGLVLVAACPGAAPSSFFTYLARGDTMLSVCLTAMASLTSAFSIPLFVNAALRLFGSVGPDVQLAATSSLALFAVATLPVAAGMLLRRRRPTLARAIERRLGAVGLVVLAFVAVVAFWSQRGSLPSALARAGGPALLLNVLSIGLAGVGAVLFGLDRRERLAVQLECALQNFALAAFVALTLLGDAALLVPPLAYALLCYLPGIIIVVLGRRAARAEVPGRRVGGDEATATAASN